MTSVEGKWEFKIHHIQKWKGGNIFCKCHTQCSHLLLFIPERFHVTSGNSSLGICSDKRNKKMFESTATNWSIFQWKQFLKELFRHKCTYCGGDIEDVFSTVKGVNSRQMIKCRVFGQNMPVLSEQEILRNNFRVYIFQGRRGEGLVSTWGGNSIKDNLFRWESWPPASFSRWAWSSAAGTI